MATSADKKVSDCVLSIAVVWGLIGCSGVVAADEEPPDAEFLEYLGSWDGPDEDWLLFDNADGKAVATDGKERSDPASADEESAESEDES